MYRPTTDKLKIGVFYLARGDGTNLVDTLKNFIETYRSMDAGICHELYVIFKGLKNSEEFRIATDVLEGVSFLPVHVEDEERDLGAYFIAAGKSDCDIVCFLNSYSQILDHDWLLKLMTNLSRPGVGLVGCTGSYETAQHPGVLFNPPFPNPHLRSNAFALRLDLFLAAKPAASLTNKLSTHLFEHGATSLTRRIAGQGLDVLVVGRDGRGYHVEEWGYSRTFRQGTQLNLLVADNRTRDYELAPLPNKRELFRYAWGSGVHNQVSIAPPITENPDEALVLAAYEFLLGRRPARTELRGWLGALGRELSPTDFVSAIARSEEGRLWRARNGDQRVFLPDWAGVVGGDYRGRAE